ncbi:MAG: hypothetical protein R3C05_05295 [Pirellulaceae bacterium]
MAGAADADHDRLPDVVEDVIVPAPRMQTPMGTERSTGRKSHRGDPFEAKSTASA